MATQLIPCLQHSWKQAAVLTSVWLFQVILRMGSGHSMVVTNHLFCDTECGHSQLYHFEGDSLGITESGHNHLIYSMVVKTPQRVNPQKGSQKDPYSDWGSPVLGPRLGHSNLTCQFLSHIRLLLKSERVLEETAKLGVPSPFFPGILLFRKPSKAWGKPPVFEENDG